MMKMNKQVIEAVKTIKDYCSSTQCADCLLSARVTCDLKMKDPCDWHIPKPRRWTDEDIALAKALKAFGATTIYRYSPDLSAWKADRNVGALPYGAFTDLKAEERLSIDDIIAEGEE